MSNLEYREKITVFGCGGDRDTSKRAPMANIAERYSSKVIITSDNPRTESLNRILSDIKSGFTCNDYIVIPDRNEALLEGVKQMEDGSILLVLGKGIENYQEINGEKIPHNDKKIILEAINES